MSIKFPKPRAVLGGRGALPDPGSFAAPPAPMKAPPAPMKAPKPHDHHKAPSRASSSPPAQAGIPEEWLKGRGASPDVGLPTIKTQRSLTSTKINLDGQSTFEH